MKLEAWSDEKKLRHWLCSHGEDGQALHGKGQVCKPGGWPSVQIALHERAGDGNQELHGERKGRHAEHWRKKAEAQPVRGGRSGRDQVDPRATTSKKTRASSLGGDQQDRAGPRGCRKGKGSAPQEGQ
ncbi:hypothetical protein GOP47_0030414 [Adiantum capillus-veneris]|nr:hypothetical protein GOP47_0030414 [Adiantum capillus-veneris]